MTVRCPVQSYQKRSSILLHAVYPTFPRQEAHLSLSLYSTKVKTFHPVSKPCSIAMFNSRVFNFVSTEINIQRNKYLVGICNRYHSNFHSIRPHKIYGTMGYRFFPYAPDVLFNKHYMACDRAPRERGAEASRTRCRATMRMAQGPPRTWRKKCHVLHVAGTRQMYTLCKGATYMTQLCHAHGARGAHHGYKRLN